MKLNADIKRACAPFGSATRANAGPRAPASPGRTLAASRSHLAKGESIRVASWVLSAGRDAVSTSAAFPAPRTGARKTELRARSPQPSIRDSHRPAVQGWVRFFIMPYLSSVRPSQAYNAQSVTPQREDKRVQSISNVSESTRTRLTVAAALIFQNECRFEIEFCCSLKGQPAITNISFALCRVEFDFHCLIVYTIISLFQAFRATGASFHGFGFSSVIEEAAFRFSRKNACTISMQRAASTPNVTSTR